MDEANRTVVDFGAQWNLFTGNEGYYGSQQLLQDIFGPLLSVEELQNQVVVEVGSGTGRIVNMLLDAGVRQVFAVEPSSAMDVCKRNTKARSDRIQYLQVGGDFIPDLDSKIDFVLSIGVIHHIPDPLPTVRRVFEILEPGGKCLFWVYGKEGNWAYLKLFLPLRKITKKMPDWMLVGLAHVLNFFLWLYILACKFLPLPLHRYASQVLGKLDSKKRMLVIFDQLNPAYAKYYSKEDVEALMQACGYKNIQLHHRHGYSWTIIGEKPS